jgi:glycosyltransferase involved in cell wall biosynthesis
MIPSPKPAQDSETAIAEVSGQATPRSRSAQACKVSIALCTYNGAPYILEQLRSIEQQTWLPDEVIICDDGSKDNTVELIQGFAEQSKLSIQVFRNSENLGYRKNFYRAMSLTQGELIFLADQDDVWHPDKVECFVNELERSPGSLVFLSNANLVDEKLNSMGSTLWQFLSLDDAAQHLLVSPKGFNFTLQQGCHSFFGMTIAFHKDLKPALHPAPEGLAHDYWVGILASALDRLCLINKPLADYRQHSKQTSGAKATGFWGAFKKCYLTLQKLRNPFFYKVIAEEHREIQARLLQVTDFPLHPEAVEILNSKATYLNARAKMHQRFLLLRLPLVYREYRSGRYARFSRGWRSILVDLLL